MMEVRLIVCGSADAAAEAAAATFAQVAVQAVAERMVRDAADLDQPLHLLLVARPAPQLGDADAERRTRQRSWSNTGGFAAGVEPVPGSSRPPSSASSMVGAERRCRPAATVLEMRASTFSKLASFWSQ